MSTDEGDSRDQDQLATNGRPLVLIVEDDHEALRLRGALIESFGAGVVLASSTSEARAALKDGGIDAVFTDIHLGVDEPHGGVDIARWAQSQDATIPVVGYSGFYQSLDEDTALFSRVYLKAQQRKSQLAETIEALIELAADHRRHSSENND